MAKEIKYTVVGGSGKRGRATVVARNVKEAVAKARRLFPRSKLITVSREHIPGGREYETYSIIH